MTAVQAAANAVIEPLLAAWLDDGDSAALTAACAQAKAQAVDVDALLGWVRAYGADPRRSELALRRLRFAIGLPVIPGPVCRPASKQDRFFS